MIASSFAGVYSRGNAIVGGQSHFLVLESWWDEGVLD